MTTAKKVIKEGKHHLKPEPEFPQGPPPLKPRRDKRRKNLKGPRREDFFTYKVLLGDPPEHSSLSSTERGLRRDMCDDADGHTFVRHPVEHKTTRWNKDTRESRVLYIRHTWVVCCAVCLEMYFSYSSKHSLVPPEAIEIEWVDATAEERARFNANNPW